MPSATTRVNYRLEESLAPLILNGINSWLRGSEDFFSRNLLGRGLTNLLEFLYGDFRAPHRDGFDNIAVTNFQTNPPTATRHTTITQAYLASSTYPAVYQYIRDNPIGWNRYKGLPAPTPVALEHDQFNQTDASLVAQSLPGFVRDLAPGVIDGGFEALNRLWEAAQSAFNGLSDDVARFLRPLFSPELLLRMMWGYTGDVRLIPNNASVQLTQTADTSLSQTVALPAGAATISFRLTAVAPGAGDTLIVSYDGVPIGTIDLTAAGAVGRHTLPLPAGRGDFGALTFRLAGPVDTPAVVNLDDIVIDGQPNAVPLAGTDVYRTDAGRPLTVAAAAGVLANDFDPEATALTAAVASPPALGILTLNPDGSFTYTPAVGFVGVDTFAYTVRDAAGQTATVPVEVSINPGVAFAVGPGRAGPVTLYNPDRTVRLSIDPFPGFTGGLRVASADFNGDGAPDLVIATGPGRATRVVVLDGATHAELFSIDPFEAGFTGGVFVAVGDLTGDGRPDLVITPDEGGGPRARVFSGSGWSQVADFFGILGDANFRGGARAAIGDVTGDGLGDVLIAAGFGGGPRVAVFDGKRIARDGNLVGQGESLWDTWKPFGDRAVFEPTLRNGVFIAAGDLDGDGFAELISGGGPGGGPRVFALSGRDLLAGSQVQRANFFGGDTASRGGIRLAVKDLDGDNRADLVVGAGVGAGSRVTAYAGSAVAADGVPPELFAFDVFAGLTDGVFVG